MHMRVPLKRNAVPVPKSAGTAVKHLWHVKITPYAAISAPERVFRFAAF